MADTDQKDKKEVTGDKKDEKKGKEVKEAELVSVYGLKCIFYSFRLQ